MNVHETHSRVLDAAGERDPAALPTGVQIRTVEVHVQVPVVRTVSATTKPLRQNDRQR